MGMIKPRPDSNKPQGRLVTKLNVEALDHLYAYAAQIQEPPAYVLNKLISDHLAEDKEYKKWRDEAKNSGPFYPVKTAEKPRKATQKAGPTAIRTAV